MTARAVLGSRSRRLGLGALLTTGVALQGCGRVELGSYAKDEGSPSGDEAAESSRDAVLDRGLDGAPGLPGSAMAAAGERDGAGGAPVNVYAAPTEGASANEGGTAVIGGVDSSTVVTPEEGDAGVDAGDAPDSDAALPRGTEMGGQRPRRTAPMGSRISFRRNER